MTTYLGRHLQVFFATLGSLLRSPISTFNTVLVVAITLLLPAMLYVMIKSAQSVSNNWQGRPQMSIFLQQGIEQDDANAIFEEIALHPQIALAELISPEQALDEFKLLSGLDNELAFLGKNPLPASIVIMPLDSASDSPSLLEIKSQLTKIDGIDQVRLDLDWTDRFNAILRLATRLVQILSALLALALILIVSNTIRLIILNRRQEIEITKLVGGTNAFVRRPFLYNGLLLGLFGGILSLLMLIAAFTLLDKPITQLTTLYGSDNPIHQLQWFEILGVIGLGSLLGWLAARISVAHHLNAIEPN